MPSSSTAGWGYPDRLLQAFAINLGFPTNPTVIYTNSQVQPGGGWTGWTSLGGPDGFHIYEIEAAQNQDGRLQIFGGAIPDGGSAMTAVFTRSQDASGEGWTEWSGVGGSPGIIRGIGVAQNANGRLEVFAGVHETFGSDKFYSITQAQPGGDFEEWGSIGEPPTSVQWGDVAQNADGRLEVFGVAGGEVYGHSQLEPGGAWGGWAPIGYPPLEFAIFSIRAARNLDGRLEVFARDHPFIGNSDVYITSQVEPGGAWGGWGTIGDPDFSIDQIEVAQNLDGRLEVFARGSDNKVWINSQQQPGGDWGTWGSIGDGPGVSLTHIAVGQNADGRLEVFALGGGQVYINSQQWPGGPWGEWGSIGGPGSDPLRLASVPPGDNAKDNLPPTASFPAKGLTPSLLQPILQAAIARWATVVGDDQAKDMLSRVTVQVADLALPYLALATPEGILVDRDAAGRGWFIDPTPDDDAEFAWADSQELRALPESGRAAVQADLLTVMLHELGHMLGFQHSGERGLMAETLPLGVRRLPDLSVASDASDEAGRPAMNLASGSQLGNADLVRGLIGNGSNQGLVRSHLVSPATLEEPDNLVLHDIDPILIIAQGKESVDTENELDRLVADPEGGRADAILDRLFRRKGPASDFILTVVSRVSDNEDR